ncbi:hypothetical protein [Streptomyces bungoensis]|nr:hypothetical protein [Streptomyces bungoensis]
MFLLQFSSPTTTTTTPTSRIRVRRTDAGLVIYDLADVHRRRGARSK